MNKKDIKKEIYGKFYDSEYLSNLLEILDMEIEDLEKWSVYNQDFLSDEIHNIKLRIKKIREIAVLFEKI